MTDSETPDSPGALPSWLARLPERWQYTLHNLVAHPASEIAWQCGLVDVAERIHDLTTPARHPDGSSCAECGAPTCSCATLEWPCAQCRASELEDRLADAQQLIAQAHRLLPNTQETP
jgi:hypothetical protein